MFRLRRYGYSCRKNMLWIEFGKNSDLGLDRSVISNYFEYLSTWLTDAILVDLFRWHWNEHGEIARTSFFVPRIMSLLALNFLWICTSTSLVPVNWILLKFMAVKSLFLLRRISLRAYKRDFSNINRLIQ